MSISDKIEELRKQPEHVRLRYVWISIAVTMFFIITIWLFSIREKFSNINPPASSPPISNDIKKNQGNEPSLEDLLNRPDSEITSPLAE